MRALASTIVVIAGLLAGGAARAETPAAPSSLPPPADFVRVEGTRFFVGDKPFAFVGANANVLQGEQVRARYRETLAALRADGLTVARVWAFAEGPADATEWYRRDHLFRAGPDGYIEAAYRHLDAVVAEAGRLGLRLIVTLSNNWSDYGGIPMYLAWAGLPVGDGPDDPVRERFYRDETTRRFFRDGVVRLLERANTVTGRRYADDPTIFSWELMNESTVVTPEGAEARRAWIVEMARLLRSRDPHHLVAAGLGGYSTRDERRDWIAVHRLPEIGYCDSHLYLEQEPRVTGKGALFDQIDDRAQLARFVVGKPLVIGEFGFRTDLPRPWLGARRDAWFRHLLSRALDDGAGGVLAWIYQPWSGKPRDFGIYVDRADTDDVRGVMRDLAGRFAALVPPRNPRLGPEVGERFLYQPLLTLRGHRAPARRHHRRGDRLVVEIEPERFAEARFERAGIVDGKGGGAQGLPHLYGSGWGRVTYRFLAPALPVDRAPASITVRARVSSEWPGAHAPSGQGAAAGSRVELLLDGERTSRFAAPPDDGRGAWRNVTLRDPALLRRLATPGVHTLGFEVDDGDGSHGLCVYGRARRGPGKQKGPAPVRGAGPIEVQYQLVTAATSPS